MRESGFWNYLKPKLADLPRSKWERIESPTSSGIPDVSGIYESKSLWIELKYLLKWEAGLGTSAIQRNWMRKWCNLGGNAFLLARIVDVVVLVPGHDLDNSAGDNIWRDRAIYQATIGSRREPFDVHQLGRALLEACR